MRILPNVLLGLTIFYSYTSAFPKLPSIYRRHDMSKRDNVTAYAYKYQKNCDINNYRALEEEGWNTTQKLAEYAQLWKKGGAYQNTANLWFGQDSADNYNRIMKNYINAYEFHDTSFWLPPNPQNRAYFEVWCAEDGTDGKPPRPDNWNGDWNADGCLTGGNAYSYKVSRWWWEGDLYVTVFCQQAWQNKSSFWEVEKEIGRIGKYNVKMNDLFKLRASTYLHEILHHSVVSSPNIRDVWIRTWQSWNPGPAYGVLAAVTLAKWQGAVKKVADADGGYNGEFGTAINADNYAMFALSVYFQETLSVGTPFEPAEDFWQDIPQETVDPVPGHPALNGGITTWNATDTNDTATQLVLPDETKLPVPLEIVPINPEPPLAPVCQAPGTAKSSADPSLVRELATIYCKKWPVTPSTKTYPKAPEEDLSGQLTGDNLSPPLVGTKLSVTFEFKKNFEFSDCWMNCDDLFQNLTSTCQTNANSISGFSSVIQSCGNFTMTVD